jgi:hypothetical protein
MHQPLQRGPPPRSPPIALQCYHILERLVITSHAYGMGLYQPHCRHLHARLRSKIPRPFPTSSPRTSQHSPHAWQKPQYGAHPQLTPAHDDSSTLAQPALTRIQEIIGTLLFNGRAFDSTMIVALGTINFNQTKGTQATDQAVTQLLNYASAKPMPQSAITSATCASIYTVTPPTSLNPTLEAA